MVPVFLPQRASPILKTKKTARIKKVKERALMAISEEPKNLNKRCSLMLYKGGEVSRAIVAIIWGMDFCERMAEKASSPHRLAVNWFTINYTFSVTRYSRYFPSISLVWASRPGSAEKKKPATGISTNSKGISRALQSGNSFGRLGL